MRRAGSDPLNVAYLSDLSPYARSLIRLNALRQAGCRTWDVATIPRGDDQLGYGVYTPWRRLVHRIGFSPDYTGAGAKLLALARSNPLDVVWVDKGLTLSREILNRAKAQSGAKLVSFSEDDMALRHNNSRRWRQALEAYDLVVTTKIANVEHSELEALGAKRVLFVRQTYNPLTHFPIVLDGDQQDQFGADISFVGTYEQARAQSLLTMANAGLSVRLWGDTWAGKIGHPNLRPEGRAAVNTPGRLDYSTVLSGTKISLGFLRKLNRDQHTSRSVEIPACGSMLLAERTPDHQSMFREGVEAEFFASDDELIEKARHYLDHEDERLQIAQAGRERCLRDYSPSIQIERILNALAET